MSIFVACQQGVKGHHTRHRNRAADNDAEVLQRVQFPRFLMPGGVHDIGHLGADQLGCALRTPMRAVVSGSAKLRRPLFKERAQAFLGIRGGMRQRSSQRFSE